MSELLPALPEDWDRCMAIAAHPDDIEYGTAGAIARWTAQGKTVTYLLATRGEAGIDSLHPDQAAPLREEEERAGAREVGVDVVEFLDHTDGVVEYGLDLRRDIARAIRRHRPEVIVSGGYDDPDDRRHGQPGRPPGGRPGRARRGPRRGEPLDLPGAARRGPRAVGRRALRRLRRRRHGPRHGVDVTGEPLQRGIASLAAHAEYTKGLGVAGPEPGPFLTWMATMSGRQMGVEAAVLFDMHPLTFEGPPPWVTDAGGRP